MKKSSLLKQSLLSLSLVLFVLCNSCRNPKENQIRDEVNFWVGKKVLLPKQSDLIKPLNGEQVSPLNKRIKVLTLVNASCGTCIEEFNKWKGFMDTWDTTSVGYIFLLYSDDNLMTFKKINSDFLKFQYPLFNDQDKKIIKANKFSDKKMFQTFLLNEADEIVIIGSPILNTSIADLYQYKISEMIKAGAIEL